MRRQRCNRGQQHVPMPHGFAVSHTDSGTAHVSYHAWKRFIMRCPGQALAHHEPLEQNSEVIANLFSISFARATPLKGLVSMPYAASYGRPCYRLYDIKYNLTYIVTDGSSPRPVVITVKNGMA